MSDWEDEDFVKRLTKECEEKNEARLAQLQLEWVTLVELVEKQDQELKEREDNPPSPLLVKPEKVVGNGSDQGPRSSAPNARTPAEIGKRGATKLPNDNTSNSLPTTQLNLKRENAIKPNEPEKTDRSTVCIVVPLSDEEAKTLSKLLTPDDWN